MNFVVAEMTRFEVEADSSEAAIESVKARKIEGKTIYTCKAVSDIKPVHIADVAAVPLDQWPLWARALKAIATPEDKGIGDVLCRTIGPENSEAFKKWYKSTTGKDCGCTGRQARWNQMYPLK